MLSRNDGLARSVFPAKQDGETVRVLTDFEPGETIKAFGQEAETLPLEPEDAQDKIVSFSDDHLPEGF